MYLKGSPKVHRVPYRSPRQPGWSALFGAGPWAAQQPKASYLPLRKLPRKHPGMKMPSSPQVAASASAGPMGPFGFPQRYLIVFLTFLCTSVCYIERLGFSLAYTSMAIRSGVDQATKGWVMSAFYCGYASSQVPGSWAAQRFGGRRVLTVSFIFWSILCVLTPTEPGPLLSLVLIRLLVGVAQGFIFPSIHTVLAQWIPPHEKSRSVSLTTSGMYFGAGLAMLCLPNLVAVKGPETVFQMVAVMGAAWAAVWVRYSTEPPGGPASFAAHLPVKDNESGPGIPGGGVGKIPWGGIMVSLPVWAIVVNNFTFHYSLYVLMNWLPTYFDQGLHASLHSIGPGKSAPYFIMFLFSNIGGIVADYLIAKRLLSVTATRKVLNSLGFFTSSVALALMPVLASVRGALFCSSVALGACALARAGFAVNHMDIAPRYAGIVMGVSNTAGTVAGIVGVPATGLILEAAGGNASSGWTAAFLTPAVLSMISAIHFIIFATGERLFE